MGLTAHESETRPARTTSSKPMVITGMASADDLRRLQRAKGRANEILFCS